MVSSGPNNTSDTYYGWVAQPAGRGTLDVLWSCLFTNFLCSWAVLCLNVPPPGESYFAMARRKFLWMLCIIIGPEITLGLALGQYCSARRSVADFKRLEKSGWTLEHAFFADMGGIMLSAPIWSSTQVTIPETICFPINAKQLHYLVEHQYLDFPDIKKHTIRDKSKSDNVARFLTSAQALWFILQCFGRFIQHLPLTTLELTTVSVVLSSLPMFWCWFKKPSDVAQPIQITMATPISTVLTEAGNAASRPYDRTPFDFVCTDDWNFDLYCSLGMELVIKIFKVESARPIDHFTTADFPRPETWAKTVLVMFELTFCGIHLAGWNFHFASRIERIAWRCSCCVMLGCYLFYWIMDSWILYMRSRARAFALEVQVDGDISNAADRLIFWRFSMKQMAPIEMKRVSSGRWETAARARYKASPVAKNHLLLPLGCTIIVIVRLYTIIEVFAGLRSVPKGVFDDVDWSKGLPHF